MAPGDVRVSAATRLRVLDSLPRRHQDHFFEVIRTLCKRHTAFVSRHGSGLDSESEALELFSEVIAKLLGVTGVATEQDTGIGSDIQPAWAISDDPKSDERVRWLINEIGGTQALKHRYEDIRRRRHGGKWRQDGYRHVQLGPEHTENLSVEPVDLRHDDDIRQIWQGVLAMAQAEFDSKADVSIVLNLMAHDSDIQAGFDGAWPITQMVETLNRSYPNPPWNDDRVENAKKRLKNWIVRLRRTHGLDEIDLMDLFARHARTQASMKGPSLTATRPAQSASATIRSEIEP